MNKVFAMKFATLRSATILAALFAAIPAAGAADAGGCAQNANLDIAHYAAALKGDAHNLGAAMFQQVPSDLTIAPESAAYLVTNDTAKRALPIESAPTLGVWPSGGRIVASCRVKGPGGDWWLVERSGTGALVYIVESTAQKISDGGATAEPKPEPRIKDPNLRY